MLHSIKNQFALIFILLMSGVVFFCWLGNTLFLGRYYLSRKTKVIYHAYLSIRDAADNNSYESAEFQNELERVCQSNNISACVINSESEMKYVSSNGGERLEMLLYGYFLGFENENMQVVREEEDDEKKIIIQRSMKNDGGFLEMYGILKQSGISFVMSTPLASIRESAAMANTFYFYSGILCTILGVIIILIVSGKITKPILALNELSERMVRQDFDAKYEGKERNEIGVLGENMNLLSSSLEKAISELKSANNELRRDIERKDKIDEMRRDFLSNVSHELKTPIALIQGYAEGLQEGMGEDPQDRDYYCEVIVDEAKKMNAIVQKLLSLNQLEFGTENAEMERFDVIPVVSAVVETAAPLIRQQGIRVEWDRPATCHVWADSYMVKEVFDNYFSNAVHYCRGEKIVRVKVENRDRKVRISVFNTGDTIPQEALSRVWEKFFKVDKARTREYGGSGVGLSIVKAMMNQMNQEYGVENQEDGVLFWFELESAESA